LIISTDKGGLIISVAYLENWLPLFHTTHSFGSPCYHAIFFDFQILAIARFKGYLAVIDKKYSENLFWIWAIASVMRCSQSKKAKILIFIKEWKFGVK